MSPVLPGGCHHHYTGKIDSSHRFLGVKMKEIIQKYRFLTISLILVAVALFIYIGGEFPRRTILKEAFSLVTILSFVLMIGQFFLSRGYRAITLTGKMSTIVKAHKFIGYLFTTILFVHPFLIVLPRYFEGGVQPLDALWTILTTLNNPGVVVGILAWLFMIVLTLTSFLRTRLFAAYKGWRWFHGVLSLAFISLAAWHVIYLGRHSNLVMKWFVVIMTIGGIDILLYTYLTENAKKRGLHRWVQQEKKIQLAEENSSL
ncbi:MAG: FAD/NAD(P)-binding:oxidoreductase [Methanobacteriota archaeon]|nr:MAG: FAD/NAD(P)-binding:oxidoreductase [Euryarchaeota archaeon]